MGGSGLLLLLVLVLLLDGFPPLEEDDGEDDRIDILGWFCRGCSAAVGTGSRRGGIIP